MSKKKRKSLVRKSLLNRNKKEKKRQDRGRLRKSFTNHGDLYKLPYGMRERFIKRVKFLVDLYELPGDRKI